LINKDIINAFKILATEKGIDKTNLSSIIEDLFINIIRKNMVKSMKILMLLLTWKREK